MKLSSKGKKYGVEADIVDRESIEYKISTILGNHPPCFGKYRRDDKDCKRCEDKEDCRRATQNK